MLWLTYAIGTSANIFLLNSAGEGYHNAAEAYYGTPAWNCYYSLLNGNSTVTWADAHLDSAGIAQAQVAHNYWRHEIYVQKTPRPQSYYVSTLTRCLQTANITFTGLKLPSEYPFVPTVKELLREHISIHTCDQRSSKAYIHNLFPDWTFEEGFAEYDELWDGVTAETNDANDARSKTWLDEVFSSDTSTWISITSHSGEIASTLRVLGHQEFALNTGAIIPVLVKAQFLPTNDAPSPISWHWTVSTHCASPPKTSKSNLSQGCLCAGKQGAITTPLVRVTNTNTAGPTTYTEGFYHSAL